MHYVLRNQWPEMQSPEARVLVQRGLAVKMQKMKWQDFSGMNTEVPSGWHSETQMVLEEINQWESEEVAKRAKRRG